MRRRHYKFNCRCSVIVTVILIELMAAPWRLPLLCYPKSDWSSNSLLMWSLQLITIAFYYLTVNIVYQKFIMKEGEKTLSIIRHVSSDGIGSRPDGECVSWVDMKKKGFRNILFYSSSLVPTCPVLDSFWCDYGCWCFFSLLSSLHFCVFSQW